MRNAHLTARLTARLTAGVTSGLTALALLAAAPAGAAVQQERLEPDRLTRGADVRVPHIEDGVFVDGERRVDLGAPRAVLLGRSGDSFVVGTTSRNGTSRRKVVRILPDDSLRTLLTKVSPWELVLSEDGRRIVNAHPGKRRRTILKVWSARTGELQRRARLKGYAAVLTARGRRVILSDWDRGTFAWRFSGRTRTITKRPGGLAHIGNNLLSSYTGDPYEGGCMKLSPLDEPRRTLWLSCDERVESIGPRGRRIATVHILSDGIGPNEVATRTTRGTLLDRYSTGGWFGMISWESPTTVLLETNGRRRAATVRCTDDGCENASDPEPVETPRPAVLERIQRRDSVLTRRGR